MGAGALDVWIMLAMLIEYPTNLGLCLFFAKKNGMYLVIRANKEQRQELEAGGIDPECRITWLGEAATADNWPAADAYMDLQFEEGPPSFPFQLTPSIPVIINDVTHTLKETGLRFIRINGWPGFLEKPIWEAAAESNQRPVAEKIARIFNKEILWCPDQPGLVSARVISQIINEAYLALEEGVSGKADIDIAMQTGTNYPLGPFAWSRRVGLKKWAALIKSLEQTNARYQAAPILVKEADDE